MVPRPRRWRQQRAGPSGCRDRRRCHRSSRRLRSCATQCGRSPRPEIHRDPDPGTRIRGGSPAGRHREGLALPAAITGRSLQGLPAASPTMRERARGPSAWMSESRRFPASLHEVRPAGGWPRNTGLRSNDPGTLEPGGATTAQRVDPPRSGSTTARRSLLPVEARAAWGIATGSASPRARREDVFGASRCEARPVLRPWGHRQRV